MTNPLPDWFPDWAKEIAELYFSESSCVFLLHGNVHDLVPLGAPPDRRFGTLTDFLARELFAEWNVLLQYDMGRGLRPMAGGDDNRHRRILELMHPFLGTKQQWPTGADEVLSVLDQLMERLLLQKSDPPIKLGIVLEFAEFLLPAIPPEQTDQRHAARLIRILNWARNPLLKDVNMAICLVAENLTRIDSRLLDSPQIATIEIPLPTLEARQELATRRLAQPFAGDYTPEKLAMLSHGLNLISLQQLITRATADDQLNEADLKRWKKDLIERECNGLLEFLEPRHTLDLVVGHEAAKQRLRQDAALLSSGRLDVAPMGYLINGSVGTGKSFLAECFAGTVGIPCVTLRNFRSKYVGETEGNLEHVLNVLRSLGPVVVIVDEADAALGNREAEGDSGTSSRVFSMIATQMGNTAYRGKIVWMLLTARPDRLPIDLKRQGRAEVHIPLFAPEDLEEVREMFRIMARKNRIGMAAEALDSLTTAGQWSGADIEGMVLAAKRKVLLEDRQEITADDLAWAVSQFLPSVEGLEKEMQELAAVLECTELSFLPDRWKEIVTKPNGRQELQRRLIAVREMLKK